MDRDTNRDRKIRDLTREIERLEGELTEYEAELAEDAAKGLKRPTHANATILGMEEFIAFHDRQIATLNAEESRPQQLAAMQERNREARKARQARQAPPGGGKTRSRKTPVTPAS